MLTPYRAPPQRALNAAAALKLLPTHRAVPSPRASPAAGAALVAAPDGSRWALLPPAPRRAAPAASPLLPLAAPARGVLLLSHPRLGDYFHRKVILLLEHDDAGARGVVLNARTRTRCSTLLKMNGQADARALYSRGPAASRRHRASYLALTRTANRMARVVAGLPAAAATLKELERRAAWGSEGERPESFDADVGGDSEDESEDEDEDSDLLDDSDDDVDMAEALAHGAFRNVPPGYSFARVEQDLMDIDRDMKGIVHRAKAMDKQATSMVLLAADAGQPLLHRCSRHDVYNVRLRLFVA